MGPWISWAISTLLLLFMNRGGDDSDSEDTNSQQPSKYTDSNVNQIGHPVPVVLGRCMVKNPLISYYGAFDHEIYTEEYGMHTELDASDSIWPILLMIIVSIVVPNVVVGIFGGGLEITQGAKNALIVYSVVQVLMMLLSRLFDDHEGRTTIQKGFKYYIGWQHIICWTGDNIGIKRIWMNVYDSKVEESTQIGVWDNNSHVAWEADNMNGITAHIEDLEMFGGFDEGGGFIGDIRIYFGNDTQPKDQFMINQMSNPNSISQELLGLTPKYPMYLTCVVSDKDMEHGAYVGKQATVPEMWFEVINYPDKLVNRGGNYIHEAWRRRVGKQWERIMKLINSMPPDVIAFMQPYMQDIEDAFNASESGSGSISNVINAVYSARAVYPGANLQDFLYLTDGLIWILQHNTWNLVTINEDANPASVIYEILTNKMWGCGYDDNKIDMVSLVEVGMKCEEEELGISCLINRVAQANEYITKILKHINGVKFDNPVNGKLTFRLIRDDYEIGDLKVFDTTNCETCEFSRLDWSETSSAISLTFTDAMDKYNESQYLETDPANRYITKNYTEVSVDGTYFTTMSNAKWLAQTTMKSAGYPLSAISLVTTRYAFDLLIGDPIKVFWEPYGIKQMIFRVTDIDYSDINDGRIKVTAIEDVFGFNKIHYQYSDPPTWIDPEYEPQDALAHRYEEAPFELTMSLDTMAYCFAAQPSDETTYMSVWRFVQYA